MRYFTKLLMTCVLLLIATSTALLAQTGTIRGTIIDDATGEELIGATAQIVGTTQGVATDIDGKFALEKLSAGTYKLQFSYVSYTNQIVENVEVKAGETTVLNIRLVSEDLGLEEIVVEAKQIKDNEAALLTLQKKSNVVLDGLSAASFSKTGDSDVAAAIKRVTGVSVEGGKYVYVRGLGDRYSKTALNNAEIPGLDPNKNTVQMDLFPSNLIDNIVVYKTFSPELPASFSGGFINIATKDFPEQFTLQAAASIGYNLNATFNDNTLTHSLGGGHFLGFSEGSRDLQPILAQNFIPSGPPTTEEQNLIDRIVDTPSKEFDLSRFSPLLNHSFSFSLGNQTKLFGKPLGFIFGASYQRNFEAYNDGRTERYLFTDLANPELQPARLLDDARGSESVLWGSLLNLSYKLNPNNKLSFNVMYNRSTDASTRLLGGLAPIITGVIDPTFRIESRAFNYVERALFSTQLKGEHNISDKNIKLDWLVAATQSQQDEPDFRLAAFIREELPDGSFFFDLFSNNARRPAHFWRYMDERNIDTKVNLEIPTNLFKSTKIKLGGAFIAKQRDFTETAYEYNPAPSSSQSEIGSAFNGNYGEIFQTFSGLIEPERTRLGLVLRDIPGLGSYEATERITAAYFMIDSKISDRFTLSTGARFERTDIDLEMLRPPLNPFELTVADLERNDILPALNAIYNITDKANLRLGYGRTLARPTFRELALFTTFDFAGDANLRGNPALQRTLIDNFDLRFEIFPRPEEIFSVSFFYKYFQNPIEKVLDPRTGEIDLTFEFRNVPEATLFGGEIEFRKKLDFVSERLSNLSIGVNFSLMQSRVNIAEEELETIRVQNPDADDNRVLAGQSPYTINALLSYASQNNGWAANLSFNIQGERLYTVGLFGAPNIFERPRPLLDFNVSKTVGRVKLKFSANNILDGVYNFVQTYQGQEFTFQRHQLGQSFSFGVSYGFER